MKLLELFSGIGGFALGLQRADFEFTEHYFSEISKSPRYKMIGNAVTVDVVAAIGERLKLNIK